MISTHIVQHSCVHFFVRVSYIRIQMTWMCFHLVYMLGIIWHRWGCCDKDIKIQIHFHVIESGIQLRAALATFAKGIPAIVTAWTCSHWYSTQILIATNICYQRILKSMLPEPFQYACFQSIYMFMV